MGIYGLLPGLAKIKTEGHVSQYEGQTVGVDALCW